MSTEWYFCTLFYFSDILRGVIDDVVASFVVLPNRISVPLTDIDPYKLKYPLPDVSQIYSTSNLMNAGISIFSYQEKNILFCPFLSKFSLFGLRLFSKYLECDQWNHNNLCFFLIPLLLKFMLSFCLIY